MDVLLIDLDILLGRHDNYSNAFTSSFWFFIVYFLIFIGMDNHIIDGWNFEESASTFSFQVLRKTEENRITFRTS